MAKNAVEKGFPLRVVAHRRREAVDDLVGRGAVECASLGGDGAGGRRGGALRHRVGRRSRRRSAAIVPAAKPGLTVIDSSTSDPEVTARLAAELARRG